MKLQTYAGFSLLATIASVYYAFSSREQFYPAMVYLSTSKICFVLLLNMGLVIMCIMWQLVKRIFLGSLREAEVERLNEQSWREVMEILFAITIFRQDFSVTFLAMITALLLIKALHWLAQKRVEHIETTPSVPLLAHIRIVSLMVFLLIVDGFFMYSSLKSLVQTRKASVALFFSFEYTILATTTLSTFVKYGFFVSDMLMDGQWERKAVYTFYLELVRDLLHLSLYICFFLAIFLSYGIPLHLIRELYETFRNFKTRVADYVRYRKLTSNMDERFPDATPEELNESDATCIICREEMTTAKKLLCGHLFHVHCLRSWLERQHTCPTCRALVVPAEGGPSGSAQQHPSQSSQAQGSGTSSGSSDADAGSDNLGQHHARTKAAILAASAYERSLNYPSINYSWSYSNISSRKVMQSTGEAASSAHAQRSDIPINHSEISASNQDSRLAQVMTQADLIQSHIQVLQSQLRTIQQQLTTRTDAACSDSGDRGNASLASTSADCGRRESKTERR